MLRNSNVRRLFSLILLATGGALLFLAPENIWVGALLLALGVLLEVVALLVRGRHRE